ncbi:hypothetical protein HNQ79_002800 [Streptomyces candidus]|uniref:Uncharacterized protein n=1 Tax=Streptomyces candidus TaxID=67283 RepID=A0A7X0LQW0_9ACTN|nr:hypothetical protein [Streptomyces candidus]
MTCTWTDTARGDRGRIPVVTAGGSRPGAQPEASLRRARYAATCNRFPQVRLSQ